MTDATRMLVIRARGPMNDQILPLGFLLKKIDGWHFNPLIAGRHMSRKGKPTWEKAIPRWAGGLNGTESRRLESGETIQDAMRKF